MVAVVLLAVAVEFDVVFEVVFVPVVVDVVFPCADAPVVSVVLPD